MKVCHYLRFALFVVCLCVMHAHLLAQSSQRGVVVEYQERGPKTALEHVSVSAINAASTISAADGSFTLQFRTLRVGDAISFRRIERVGYEVFNTEALEHERVGRDERPLTIVMCSTERLNALRNGYRTKAEESYERQLKKDEAEIARLRDQGKLKEEEYRQQIAALEARYEEQLDKIETYVDRFARIDLSAIADEELQIIRLVQEGLIDEAIVRYENQHLVEKYQAERSAVGRLAEAQKVLQREQEQHAVSSDSILSAVERQVNLLRLAGGSANFQKIGAILEQVVASDTTQARPAIWLADYCDESQNVKHGIEVLRRALPFAADWNERIQIRQKLAALYTLVFDYVQSDALLTEAFAICDASADEAAPFVLRRLKYNILTVQAANLFRQKRDAEAATIYLRQVQLADSMYTDEPDEAWMARIDANFRLGNFYYGTQRYAEAIPCLKVSLEAYGQHVTNEALYDFTAPLRKAHIECTLAMSYMSLNGEGDAETSRELMARGMQSAEAGYARNPDLCRRDMAIMCFQNFLYYAKLGDAANQLKCIDRALELFGILAKQSPEAYNPIIEQISAMRAQVAP